MFTVPQFCQVAVTHLNFLFLWFDFFFNNFIFEKRKMININIVEEMKNLSALNYTPEAIKAFLVNFSLERILQDFLDDTDKRNNQDAYIINTTVKKLINDRDTFKIIISDANLKGILEQFVMNEKPFYKELIAEGILNNVNTAREIFDFFKEQHDNPIIEGYIKIIYHLFRDEESSVGLKISKFFVKVKNFF